MQLSDDILGQAGWSTRRKWLMFFASCFAIIAIVFVLSASIGFISALLGIGVDDFSFSGLFIILMLLGTAHIAVWAVLKLIYRRGFYSLINPFALPYRDQIRLATIYTLTYLAFAELIAQIFGGSVVQIAFVWVLPDWLFWLLPYVLAVLIQTSAEEVVFRGYMQQYLASLVRQRWVFYVVPSLLWASLHIGNLPDYPITDNVAVLSTFVLGLVLADWAHRSRSLIGPIAVHFVNNFVLIAIYGNSIQPAEMQILRSTYDGISDQSLALMTVASTLGLAAIYLLIRPRLTDRSAGPLAVSE